LLGIGTIAGETMSGMIRTTFVASPGRLRVLVSKIVTIVGYLFLVGILSVATAAVVAGLILVAKGYPIDVEVVGDAILPALGCGAFLALVGLLAMGVGTVLPQPGIAGLVVITLLFVAPALVVVATSTLGGSADWVAAALPATAGQSLFSVFGTQARPGVVFGSVVITPVVGFGILLAWVAVTLIPAAVVFAHRDLTRPSHNSRLRGEFRLRSSGRSAEDPRATWRGAVKAEWLKLLSLPSNRWSIPAFALALIGYGLLRATTRHPADVGGSILEASRVETVYAITAGIGLAQLLVAIVAVTAVTGEYSSGTIKPTLVSVPRRQRVALGKGVVVVGSTIALSAVLLAITAVIIVPAHEAGGFHPELLGTATYSAVVNGTIYLALIAVLAVGVGGITRNALAGVITMTALLIVLPSVFNVILAATRGTSTVWIGNLGQFLPASGDRFYQHEPQSGGYLLTQFAPDGSLILTPGQGLAVLASWSAIAFAFWLIRFLRRDA
ncbi:MAG: ABC transporter permease, partial [Rhodoglobus sp.]